MHGFWLHHYLSVCFLLYWRVTDRLGSSLFKSIRWDWQTSEQHAIISCAKILLVCYIPLNCSYWHGLCCWQTFLKYLFFSLSLNYFTCIGEKCVISSSNFGMRPTLYWIRVWRCENTKETSIICSSFLSFSANKTVLSGNRLAMRPRSAHSFLCSHQLPNERLSQSPCLWLICHEGKTYLLKAIHLKHSDKFFQCYRIFRKHTSPALDNFSFLFWVED